MQVAGKSGTDYDGIVSAKVTFSIIGKSLSGATLYEVNVKSKSDVSDTTFTYNGGALDLGVALNGEPLTLSVEDDPTTADKDETVDGDYTVTYYNAAGNTAVTGNEIVDAGDYIAVVTGDGDYEGAEVQIKFTVGKLNLATAGIVVQDTVLGTTVNGTVNGTQLQSLNGSTANAAALNAALSFDYPVVPTKADSYSVTLSAKGEAAAKNIEGTKTLSYNVVASNQIYVQYGTGASADEFDEADGYKIDLSQGQSFNIGAISVYAGADNTGDKLTSGEYTVTVTDKDGKTVPASSLSTPGTWSVTVAVDSAEMDYALGGKATAQVTVFNGQVAAGDIFVTYDGKAQSSISKTYTGENYLPNVAVKVVVGGKTLVQGTDYEVAITDAKGEEVAEIVDAGSYKVTVTSNTWEMPEAPNNVCEITVDPIGLSSALVVANTVTVDGQTGVAYTGSDITPAFEYASVDEGGDPVLDKNDDPVMAALPASAYKITKIMLGTKEVKAINAVGTYTLTLADADTDDNFALSAGALTATVTVIDAKVFQDVPADAWYAQVVDQAAKNGYMGGYAGTKLFGPNDKITRAQVACVLFNMAGGDYNTGNDNSDSSNYGYVSFDDVKPGAYYAKAVAWAKDAGVVNGFAGTNNFGPDQVVTREQFACMLWNYANAMLSPTVKDVDVAAALASKPDGAKVSGWAREGVAWAVQNKVMGNGGVIDPLATVTRAETAAMAVNFQPEFIKAAVTGITATAPTGNLTAGSTYDPQVAVTAKNGASTAFTARSSDEAVATVAADGKITAVAAGTATITYTTVGSTVNGAKLSTSIVVTVA